MAASSRPDTLRTHRDAGAIRPQKRSARTRATSSAHTLLAAQRAARTRPMRTRLLPRSSADHARTLTSRTAGTGPIARGSSARVQQQMRVRRQAGRWRGVVRLPKVCISAGLRRLPELRRHLVEGGRLGLDLVVVVVGPVKHESRGLSLSFCTRRSSRASFQASY